MTEKKPRVYQVAKDFNISSEALLEILKSLGASAKSHMSTVDPEAVERVRDRFREEKEAVQAHDVRKQEVHDARKQEAKAQKSPEPKVVEPEPVAPVEEPVVIPEPRESATRPVPSKESRPKPIDRPRTQRPSTGGVSPRPQTKSPILDRKRPAAKQRRRRPVANEQAVRDNVKRTLASLSGGGKSKRYKKKDMDAAVAQEGAVSIEEDHRKILVNDLATVAELADRMEVPVPQVITKLLGLGKMATQNQRLDQDTIELVALEFGCVVEFQEEFGADRFETDEMDNPEDLQSRPPVVTVMGHVDHGKTSLLDYVRKANVVAGEKGGITQHIGAYEVELGDGRQVAFLDTPGHQAFTAMRARGAQVTDIVILVLAADDRVMPQTVEAIDHAKAAEVPIVVAINKVDKPEANVERIKQDLASHNLMIEEYGGTVPAVEISAKTGQGIDDLMEVLLLQADLLELKANPNRRARGIVIESKIEQGRGNVATVLVQTGTLAVGDPFVCGSQFGKVRAISNERGKRIKKAGPSTPVEVTGWSGTPAAGDILNAMASESDAREIGMERGLVDRERRRRTAQRVRLSTFHDHMAAGHVEELRLILKADVAGSVEVLTAQLEGIKHEEVRCVVIHSGVGQVTESDVLLATASSAVIIGFNVKTEPGAQAAAQRESIDIKDYGIIYEAVADVTSALEGLLKPEQVEREKATVEVRQVFRITRVGTIAGCYVQSGTIERGHQAKVMRGDEEVFIGSLSSLKRFKEDVKEVAAGYECGVGLEGFNDLKEGDLIKTFIVEEIARRL